jgi:hypothetical protein
MPKEIEKNCGFGMAEKKLQGKNGSSLELS